MRLDGSADSARAVAQGLGWFSIGLGLVELVAPRAMARCLGMEGSERLLQAYGAREIATGVGILLSENPAPWLWGRVGGDALDLATLAPALGPENEQRMHAGMAVAAVAGVMAVDAWCAQTLSVEASRPRPPAKDYSDRSGFPRGVEHMRGTAKDAAKPRDYRPPDAVRPYVVS